ncbi:MAG: hypothetical protein COA38_15395 [Fluviicola sp.]|nr:MAG: hypothetical protein COA38_15395 [Fluviicola sp.]
MSRITFILISILITSCVNQENLSSVNELNQIVEQVANKHNCKLTYEIFISDEKTNPLNLTLHNSVDYTATVGSIIEDCYLELSKKNIYYDRYILKNNQGVLGIDISRKDLEKVLKCKPTAERVIESLADKTFLSVATELDSVHFKPEQIELMQKYCEEKFSGKVEHIGFEAATENGQLYCAYVAFIDTTFVGVTINLSKDNCKIFGISF